MAYPVSPGYPQFSGNFIPELWSGKLLVKFYDATVLASISNTDYEGQISDMGDKVIIRTTPSITIRDYRKGQKLQSETPDADPIELLIDKGKYFQFALDDVDARQADVLLMDEWSTDASEQMKITVDTEVLASLPAQVDTYNKGATAGVKSGSFNLGSTGASIALTKANILDYIVDLGTVLDEANIPETGRWLLLPPWACGLIKKSDLKDASLTGDGESVMRNGRIGMIDRFEIFRSNLIPTTTDGADTVYNMLAGTKHGLTFASQMTKMEKIRSTETFADLVRGLNIYGYKVIKDDALALLYAKRG